MDKTAEKYRYAILDTENYCLLTVGDYCDIDMGSYCTYDGPMMFGHIIDFSDDLIEVLGAKPGRYRVVKVKVEILEDVADLLEIAGDDDSDSNDNDDSDDSDDDSDDDEA